MKQFGTVLKRPQITSYRYGEIVLSIHAVIWGILLIWPEDIFESVRRFEPLYLYLPDWILGIILTVIGILLISLKSIRVRRWLHGIIFGIWCFVGYLGLLSGITLTTLLISSSYFTLAAMHAGKWWQLTQENVSRQQD